MLSDEAIIGLVALVLMCAPAALIIYRRIKRRFRPSTDIEVASRDMQLPSYQPRQDFRPQAQSGRGFRNQYYQPQQPYDVYNIGDFVRPFHAHSETRPHTQPHYSYYHHHHHRDYQQERRPPTEWPQSETTGLSNAGESLFLAQHPQTPSMTGFVSFEFSHR